MPCPEIETLNLYSHSNHSYYQSAKSEIIFPRPPARWRRRNSGTSVAEFYFVNILRSVRAGRKACSHVTRAVQWAIALDECTHAWLRVDVFTRGRRASFAKLTTLTDRPLADVDRTVNRQPPFLIVEHAASPLASISVHTMERPTLQCCTRDRYNRGGWHAIYWTNWCSWNSPAVGWTGSTRGEKLKVDVVRDNASRDRLLLLLLLLHMILYCFDCLSNIALWNWAVLDNDCVAQHFLKVFLIFSFMNISNIGLRIVYTKTILRRKFMKCVLVWI